MTPKSQTRLGAGIIAAVFLLVTLFLVKALVLAFFITPLWDIPDETAHFAYARDLYSGRGGPVLGLSVVDADIMVHVTGVETASTQLNWIVQHPPAYHIVAGAVWKLASLGIDSPETLFRAPRVVSALAGALTLLVLFRLLLFLSDDAMASLTFAIGVGFIPMLTHMASGTNHDTTLTLFATLATLYWARFIVGGQKPAHAYLCAMWLGLASFTKLTALVLAVPMLAVIVYEISGPLSVRLQRSALVVVIWFTLPGLWMAWCMYHYGSPLVTAHDIIGSFRYADNPLTHSLGHYLVSQPAFEHFFINFWGLFGWMGTGRGELLWLQLISSQLAWYSALALILVLVSFWSLGRSVIFSHDEQEQQNTNDSLRSFWACCGTHPVAKAVIVALFTGVAMGCFIVVWQNQHLMDAPGSLFRSILYSVLPALAVFAVASLCMPQRRENRLEAYCWIISVFFMGIILLQVYEIYLLDGRLRATHGRYLYPLIPLMSIGGYLATRRLLQRYAALVYFLVALALVRMEFRVFTARVIPFYTGGG